MQGASIAEVSRSLICVYGAREFWKGSTMRLGRLPLSGSVVFSVYEEVSAILSSGSHR
jgi:solute carrier family 25 citrate transporter 1